MKPTTEQRIQIIRQLIQTAEQDLCFLFWMGSLGCLVVGSFVCLFVWICGFVVDRWGHG